MSERYIHRSECPECGVFGATLPAEGVPDQSLRACASCEAIFFEDAPDVHSTLEAK